MHERDLPGDRARIGGDIEQDIRLVGDDRLRESLVPESEPAVIDLDDDLATGLVAQDRLEGLVQVDPAVLETLDVEHAVREGQRHDLGLGEEDLSEAPREIGPIGDDHGRA